MRVERLLSTTHVPLDTDDLRRMDLIAPGLQIHSGVPLFLDITVCSPITAAGTAQPGSSNKNGHTLEQAALTKRQTYADINRCSAAK